MSIIRKNENIQGRIKSKKGNLLSIAIIENTAEQKQCAGGSKGCDSGCGACSGIENNTTVTIYTPEAADYEINSVIAFNYYSINDIVVLGFAFGIPVLCACAVLLLWYANAPDKIESPLAVFSIVSSFCAGFLLIWLTDSVLRKKLPAHIITPPQNSKE